MGRKGQWKDARKAEVLPLLLFPSDVTRIPAAAAVAAPPTANAMATDERAHGHVSRANGPPRPEPPLVGGTPLPTVAAAAPRGKGFRWRKRILLPSQSKAKSGAGKTCVVRPSVSCGERVREGE